MIETFRIHQLEVNKKEIGAYHLVLIENIGRKDKNVLVGRTDTNKLCKFDNVKVLGDIPKNLDGDFCSFEFDSCKEEIGKGDYVIARIDDCSNNTLYATAICKVKRMSDFFIRSENHPYIFLNNNKL